ncbi:hypothetical protein ACE10Z_23855 [Bradyrhizobium sp. Pha-3]|uniref:hypothetical protein n=1 Tax=Bradyrhizobium sp. Pha-3 TaxID=208375 RepID=UPI0035D50D40
MNPGSHASDSVKQILQVGNQFANIDLRPSTPDSGAWLQAVVTLIEEGANFSGHHFGADDCGAAAHEFDVPELSVLPGEEAVQQAVFLVS